MRAGGPGRNLTRASRDRRQEESRRAPLPECPPGRGSDLRPGLAHAQAGDGLAEHVKGPEKSCRNTLTDLGACARL